MFKDADEALARLEAELLMEESLQEEPIPEDEDTPDDEAPSDYNFRDSYLDEDPAVYQNFANGYRAYNTDISDEDLDDYSEDVRLGDSNRSNTFLILILCFLSLGVVAVLLLWLFWFRGVL